MSPRRLAKRSSARPQAPPGQSSLTLLGQLLAGRSPQAPASRRPHPRLPAPPHPAFWAPLAPHHTGSGPGEWEGTKFVHPTGGHLLPPWPGMAFPELGRQRQWGPRQVSQVLRSVKLTSACLETYDFYFQSLYLSSFIFRKQTHRRGGSVDVLGRKSPERAGTWRVPDSVPGGPRP